MQAKALDTVVPVSKDKETIQPPLIVHIIFRLAVGGLENGVVNIINRMPENSYRHAIISLTDATEFQRRITRSDVKVYCLNKKPGRDVTYLYRLWRLLQLIKPDVVHTRNLAALETTLVTSLMGIKYRIHSEHGWGVKDDNVKSNIKYLIYRRLMSKLVHRYIGLSKNIESMLIENIKVPKRKVRQVYNGVDSEKFKQAICKNRYDLFPDNFINSETILIGTVGRMDPVKDQITLLTAFIKLLKDNRLASNLRLVMIGDGEMRPEIENIIAMNNVHQQVWLAGSKDNIHLYMQQMDIFCLPSKNEGISNTILEAMACSLPVVATDVGGNGELIANNETGMLVPAENPDRLAEKLAHYVEDIQLRMRHGKLARKRVVDNFSLEKMVQNYVSIYEGL